MSALLETIHALGLLTCFALLGTSRIGACIRWLSFQGILFGLVPLIVHHGGLSWRPVLLAAGNIALKGIVFPWLLLRLRARADYQPRGRAVRRLRRCRSCSGSWRWALSVWLASEMKPALRQAPFVMLELGDLPDRGRPVPDHQPAQRADAGDRLPGAGERHLRLRRDHRRRDAAAGRAWASCSTPLSAFS